MEMPHQHSQRRKLLCFGRAINRQLGGILGLVFAGYVLLASQNPYPITVYSVAILLKTTS